MSLSPNPADYLVSDIGVSTSGTSGLAAAGPSSGEDEDGSAETRSLPKKNASRASKACQQCRLRKARCDNKQPACSGCARRSTECVYLDDDRRRSGSKTHVAKLEARLQDLERRQSSLPPLPPQTRPLVLPTPHVPLVPANLSPPMANPHPPAPLPLMSTASLSSPSLPSLTPPAHVDFAESFGATVQRDLDSKDGTRTPYGQAHNSLATQIKGVKGHMSIADGGQLRWFGATSSRHLSFGVLALAQFGDKSAQTVSKRCTDALARQGHIILHNDKLEDRILSLYFAWHNPFFHILQEKGFRADRRRCLAGEADHRYFSWALYFAMLAYAAPLSDDALKVAKEAGMDDAGDKYMQQARICIDQEMDSPSETTIQALAIMAAREVSCGRDARGWMYINMSSSCAVDLGLHQDASEWIDRGKLSAEQYAARNNCWWGVYTYASLWGLYVGRPSLFQGQDVTCPHPSAQEDMAFQGELASLLQITNTMIQELYSGTNFMASPAMSTAECHKKLTEWHSSLSSNNSLDTELNPIPSPHIILLHLQFYVTMLLLHRPFLADGPVGPDFEVSCTASASVACLLEMYRRSFGFNRIAVVAVHQIFTTATTLVYIIYCCDEAQTKGVTPPACAKGIRNHLLICLAALSALASKQLHARRSYLSLVCLMKRWHVQLNDPSNNAMDLGDQGSMASSGPPAEQFRWLSHSLYQMSSAQDNTTANSLWELPWPLMNDPFSMANDLGTFPDVDSNMFAGPNPNISSFFTGGDTLTQWDGPSLTDLFGFPEPDE